MGKRFDWEKLRKLKQIERHGELRIGEHEATEYSKPDRGGIPVAGSPIPGEQEAYEARQKWLKSMPLSPKPKLPRKRRRKLSWLRKQASRRGAKWPPRRF